MLNSNFAKKQSVQHIATEYKDELTSHLQFKGESLYPKFEDAIFRLETTNICNHKCLFCPHSKHGRKKREIDPNLAFRLIKEAADLGMKKAGLFINGEPFTSSTIDIYVKYAKDVGFTNIFITTNGSLLTKERLVSIVDAGVDSIKFSFNAGSRETYKQVHGQDDYDKVFENLRFAHEYRQQNRLNYRILSGFVVTQINQNEVEPHYEKIGKYVDDIIFTTLGNYGGYTVDEIKKIDANDIVEGFENIPIYKYQEKSLPCSMLFNSVYVTCEGYLTLCCNDTLNYLVTEDLNKMSIKEAWYSPKMVEMRTRHLNHDIENTQCNNCIYNKCDDVTPLNEKLFLECQEK